MPSAIPVLPEFGGPCIVNVVPALLARNDPENDVPGWIPATARRAAQIVLLVVDGLGWEQLRARPQLAPTLLAAEGIDHPITSVAPTTTACALTSITTGRPPCQHGVLGYRLAVGDEILNVLRWRTGSGRPRSTPGGPYRPGSSSPSRPFPDRPHRCRWCPRHEFGGTGFTAAHLGNSPLHGYKVASSLPVEVGRLLRGGEPFIYAYYDGIDKVAHGNGLGDHYDAELRAVDRLVEDLAAELPPGAALVVTADHGQIDVGPRVELLGREIMSLVQFLSGEGRFRWLHARPGAADDLLAAASERYGDNTWVRARDQLIEEGLFGGTPSRAVARPGWGTWPCSPTVRSPSSTPPTPARADSRAGTAR